ncbi:MAG: transcriptional repressor LexA [Deltaproteobacteria bacterium]|nr:transcriptional repressor LexA [Deltaproteobacteria bacterium]MCW5807538.1 transcriptional repressor LexA [Deltaproteobacteria bacterium]
MADALTQRQREILDFISASIAERGFPPTLREIGEHFHIRSTNGVNDHLKALEKKGVLRREDLKSRAMRPVLPDGSGEIVPLSGGGNVTPLRRAPMGTGLLPVVAPVDEDDMAEIPILGKVAAGQPILAVEQAADTVKIDRVLIGGHREVFGLRIVGESMIEDGILDGDYVFVKKTPSARTGEIVVAMIDGEATVKRYYPEGDKIRFQPANANMAPIIVRKSEFKSVDIIGIVVGVYRKL